jgi:hypothetical protein
LVRAFARFHVLSSMGTWHGESPAALFADTQD